MITKNVLINFVEKNSQQGSVCKYIGRPRFELIKCFLSLFYPSGCFSVSLSVTASSNTQIHL